MYEERPFEDSDTKLIKFTDKDPDGISSDVVTYVKFKYDLTHRQIDSIKEAAEDVKYEDFPTFDDWVEAVIEKARKKHKTWWFDSENDWEFWDPFPCLEVEV